MDGAKSILLAAGFSESGDTLSLARNDPALLYMVHALVDAACQAAEPFIQ